MIGNKIKLLQEIVKLWIIWEFEGSKGMMEVWKEMMVEGVQLEVKKYVV